jgi:ATP-dependent DNA helicase RecG
MTKTELLELIKNGESSGVEFKRDTIDNRALAKELVAFANLRGGRVILGVDDDGNVAGITRDRLEEWVMTACRDKIRPELIPYYEVIRDVEPGKDVAVVQVDRGWTVHHVWHKNHRTYYIRVGTQSREASTEELERLFQQRGAFRLEVRVVSGSSAGDFDYRRLRDYFGRVRQQDVPPEKPSNEWLVDEEAKAREQARNEGDESRWKEIFEHTKALWLDDTERQWRTLLVNTEFLVEEGDNIPATVGGLLLFCTNPNRFLPQAGIDAAAYPGKEKDYAAKERLAIRGPMTALFGSEGLVENGLVEQAVEFTKRNTKVTATLADGARREERWSYPEEAVREAIVNALVHRDYLLSGTTIELSIYEDRLEVISPGRLPNGITPQCMLTGCRSARNQLLKDVMRDYGYLEHMGMGVPRKIVKGMQRHNGTLPDLIEDGELFTVRLWNEE